MSGDGLRDELVQLKVQARIDAAREQIADAVLDKVQARIDAAREQVAKAERLLAEKSAEVDDKSRVGHAVADAWMTKAYQAEAERDAAVARAEAAEQAVQRVRELANSVEGIHNPGCEGEAECAACWHESILRALDETRGAS